MAAAARPRRAAETAETRARVAKLGLDPELGAESSYRLPGARQRRASLQFGRWTVWRSLRERRGSAKAPVRKKTCRRVAGKQPPYSGDDAHSDPSSPGPLLSLPTATVFTNRKFPRKLLTRCS